MDVPPELWARTFGGGLGMTYEEAGEGYSRASLVVRPGHCNPLGVCHGGAILAFADDTVGHALHALCPEGQAFASTGCDAHFLRSARPGDRLTAETELLSRGRRTALTQTRVTDARGQLVALFTSSVLFLDGPPGGGALPADAT